MTTKEIKQDGLGASLAAVEGAGSSASDQRQVAKLTVPEVMPLASAFYYFDGNGVGGSLHIVLDDQNIEDGSIDFCIEYAQKREDIKGVLLGKLLRTMSKTQRGKIAHNHRGYYEPKWALPEPEFIARAEALLAKVGTGNQASNATASGSVPSAAQK